MTLTFKISFEIYNQDSVIQAIDDFSEVSKISLDSETLKISWESEEEIREIFWEFMNYVISL